MFGVEARKHGNRRKRAGGDLEGEHEQGNERLDAAAEEKRHDEQIARLREHAQRKYEEHERRDASEPCGDGAEEEEPQQHGHVGKEPRHEAEEEVPHDEHARVELGDGRVVVAVGVLEDLVAQEIDGHLIHDVL